MTRFSNWKKTLKYFLTKMKYIGNKGQELIGLDRETVGLDRETVTQNSSTHQLLLVAKQILSRGFMTQKDLGVQMKIRWLN